MRRAGEVIFRPYARIILSRSVVAGALVFLSIGIFPRLALATIAAAAIANGLSLLLGFGSASLRDGNVACMAVLTTLATNVTLGQETIFLVVFGAVLAVILTNALDMFFGQSALPALSLPFVLASWGVVLVARMIGVAAAPLSQPVPWAGLPAGALGTGWLDVPAAIVFVHGALAGGLLLVAILWHSRITFFLAAIGGAAAWLTRMSLNQTAEWSVLDTTAAFNAILTAMALGGAFFVPAPSAMLLALLGGVLATLLTHALVPVVSMLSLPLLSLPFAVTTILILAAMRMRENDRRPATALPADNPEEALGGHLMRIRRYGEFAWLPFRLPFRGPWIVTQGHFGKHTHKGPWRFAFDFEVTGSDGATFQGAGQQLRDYHCYNLPVLAAGSGTVEQVIDGIADNPIGGINARDNWGNVVVIAHGLNLYSVAAHLKPRSVTVKPGDTVLAGTEIGRCGNSGRSLVPHLHFQVQRGAVLGSQTLPADFGDVVSQVDGTGTVFHRVIPAEQDVVRPVLRDQSLADALAFPTGSTWLLTDQHGRQEAARVEVDIWSRRMLRSRLASLYLDSYESGLVLVAFRGDHKSLLRSVLLAMARVPFDHEARLAWQDRVPRRMLSTRWWSSLDLLSMFTPRLIDFNIAYSSRRTEGTLVVTGKADRFETEATLSLGDAPHVFRVTVAGTTTVITLAAINPDSVDDWT